MIDGGIVDIPSLRIVGGDIGLPDGRAYACFAETALLALTGHRGHFSIGAPGLDLVDAHPRARGRPGAPRVRARPADVLRPTARGPDAVREGRRMKRVVLWAAAT